MIEDSKSYTILKAAGFRGMFLMHYAYVLSPDEAACVVAFKENLPKNMESPIGYTIRMLQRNPHAVLSFRHRKRHAES